MRQLFLISSLLSISTSRYILYDGGDGGTVFHRLFKSDRKITERELNNYLTVMKNYPEYVPKEIQRIFRNLSSRATRDLLTFVNEIRGDYIELSTDPTENFEIIQIRVPELGININPALSQLVRTIGKLSTRSKETFHKFWIMFFESISAPNPIRSMFLSGFFAELLNSFRNADYATLREIYYVSPETYRLLKSM
ncbi:hypothetical protein NECAME_07940 [Necator americanus]|uniref:Uncharacterized protein n=1 Tax=Necator americanus TaxID=51031 RepID=W2TK90_NECAM|nr:hypothetical protein NECAME_07940 [Necator americanus]ETN82495.1 hypothetical protein NECAME_07940 [Necator americanus]